MPLKPGRPLDFARGKQAMVFVLVTVLIDTIGFGMIAPVLPALVAQLSGEPINRAATYGGWLAFVYAMLQFLCAPTLGNLSDRFGRRVVLLMAVGALGCDYIVMGLAPTRYGLSILGRASQKQVVNVAQRGGMCGILVGRPPGRLRGPAAPVILG